MNEFLTTRLLNEVSDAARFTLWVENSGLVLLRVLHLPALVLLLLILGCVVLGLFRLDPRHMEKMQRILLILLCSIGGASLGLALFVRAVVLSRQCTIMGYMQTMRCAAETSTTEVFFASILAGTVLFAFRKRWRRRFSKTELEHGQRHLRACRLYDGRRRLDFLLFWKD